LAIKNEVNYISYMQGIDPSFPSTIALPDAEGETNKLWSTDDLPGHFSYCLKKKFQNSKVK
jgi:hypothetical protein